MKLKYIGRGHKPTKQKYKMIDIVDNHGQSNEGPRLEDMGADILADQIRLDHKYITELEHEVIRLRGDAALRAHHLRKANNACQRKTLTLNTLRAGFARLFA